MSSIYLAPFNSGEPVPFFKKKGISHLMPGPIGLVRVAVEAATFFHYPAVFLQLAVIAISTGLVAELDSGFSNIFKPLLLSTLFEIPVCTFRFKELTPEARANLKALGLQQDMTNSNLFSGSPPPANLGIIMGLGPIDDRVRPGHVGSDGFVAWVYLMKGVQAFITARNNTDGRANMRYSLKTSVKFDKEGDIMRVGKDIFKSKHGFSSGRSVITSNDIFLHPPKDSMKHFPGQFAQLQDAKGTPPSTTGFFFPYFAGMLNPDKTTASEVFLKFFTHTLGPTFSQQNALAKKIISGTRALAYSPSGLALSHIYRILDLSLDMEDASLCILLKGTRYLGVILSCHPDIKIHMYGKVFSAGPIVDEIRKVDLLESQAEKIVGLLNEGAMDIDGVVPRTYVLSEFLTSRAALRTFNSIRTDAYASSDILNRVREIIAEMDFADSFPPISASNIKLATTAMTTSDFTTLSDFPAFLGSTILHDRSPIAEALSMFGPSAPSFNTGGNDTINFNIPPMDKNDSNLVLVNGKRPLAYLPFWSVPSSTAISQWKSAVRDGAFKMPKGRKDKKEFVSLHRVVVQISQSEDISQVYNGLKVMAEAERSAARAGTKRKRQGEGEGSKRVKVMESEVLELY